MRKGVAVTARTPRGPVKTGRYVGSHDTHNGVWLEIAPTGPDGKLIKGADTFRARPASVSEVK